MPEAAVEYGDRAGAPGQLHLIRVIGHGVGHVVGDPVRLAVAGGDAAGRAVGPGEIVQHPHGVDDVVRSAGQDGLSPVRVQALKPAAGQGIVTVERMQLERPLQDVKDRRQQRRLQVDIVEDRALVDQVGEAAHVLHPGDLNAGPVALAVKDRVERVAQPPQPVRRDDVFQNEKAVVIQRAALRGRQRLGDEPQFQQFVIHIG